MAPTKRVITHVRADNFTVGQNNHVYTDTNTYYTYWDEAKQSSIRINASNPNNPNSGLWAPGMSSLTYDVNGHITTLVDQTAPGGAVTVKYRNDAYGQVLVREESKNGVIGPRQLYYYFAGMRIGDVGNNGLSPSLVDYAQQLAMRGATQPTGLYRNGRPVASADFDENYQPINAGYPGGAATSYTVRDGDTLYSIARALWGDQAMWFLIAEANGITTATQLVPGQRLIIPNKVTNFHNNTGTFRVYDPGEAIGDTMPTLPNEPAPPPAKKKGGCGVLGQILGFIISIAVSFLLPGIGQVAGKVIGKAIGGAIGGMIGTAAGFGIQMGLISAVSQGINVAVGIQDSFSWKDVGISALGGFLFGPGALPAKGGSIGTIAKNIAVGAAVNAAVQGIAVAAGLQDEFSWGSVAAAGVSGGLGGAINANSRGGKFAKSVAQGLARATARSLVDGTDFGDTLIAELPGVIATTIGNFAVDQITRSRSPEIVYGDVGTDNQVVGGGTETRAIGAGDGSMARPVAGIVGGGQVGGSDAGGEEIVVIADRTLRDLVTSPWMSSAAFYNRYVPNVSGNLMQDIALAGGIIADNKSAYLSSISGGNFFSSYTPSVWGNVKAEFNFVTAPGYRLRDSAYQDIRDGSYLIGSIKYAGSLASRTFATAFDLPINLLLSSARGRGFMPAPVDRQDAVPLMLAFGGIEALSSKVGGLGFAAKNVVTTPLNTRIVLQGVTDRAVGELAVNPSLARSLMSRGSYEHLVEGTGLAPASYGKAVERLTARYVRANPELSQILSYQSRPFVSTPDFFGYEGQNLRLLDITTEASRASHLARPYGTYTEFATHPGLPSNLVFPR